MSICIANCLSLMDTLKIVSVVYESIIRHLLLLAM